MAKRKKSARLPASLESGRDRNKRLKLLREKRRIQAANETPEHREARLQRIRDRRRKRLDILGAMTTDKFIEEISRIVPQKPTFNDNDFGDHPAISLQKLVGIKEEVELFDEPIQSESDESEIDDEEVDLTQDTFKLNAFKIRCLDLQRHLDKAEADLKFENRRNERMRKELQELRQKALKLEDLYGIPIV